jgi:ubiquinone biosynthesis protein
VLLRLFDIARKYKMEIQPQLILLQKTLVNVEGLGRELYPDLDIWKTAKPVLEKWLMEQSSPVNAIKRIIKQWPQIMRDLSLLPERISAFLKTISQE